MKYQLGEVEIPTIVASSGSGPLFVLEFDSPPEVSLGEVYRTASRPLGLYLDLGSFLALWRDGCRLHVKATDGWCPTNGHIIVPRGDW